MGAIERYSFKRVKTNGGYKYYVNGIEVNQTEYNRKSAEAKEKKEGLLGSTLEEHKKMNSKERIDKLRKKMELFKEGGVVKKKKINSKSIVKKYFRGIF
tara:strand:- start:152 stop:448 length:297 start_codon:yes stop_codon:yes gene_type:complete